MLSPARIARTASAILLLSLLQVVVAPVLAPSTFSAPANATVFDANNFKLSGNALNCGTTTCTAVPTTYNTLTPTSTNVAGEVQLTAASGSQAGFVWSKERITLGSSFDIQAQIYLGNSNAGADGLAFVLQTASTSAGSSGGGIGYFNIPQPCFAVEFDTYQNSDIANDHAALMRCSTTDNHNYFTSGNLSTGNTTTGSVDLGDIEDGYWRNVRFIWTAPATPTAAGTFVVKFDRNHDGVDDANDTLFTTSINFYDYFGSASVGSVYWGFTAATGGAVNVQAVKGLDYVVVPRTNPAPTITTPPTNDVSNTAAGTYTKTFSMQDDATLQGQWTFTTTSSNQGRVATTSTVATSATSATTSYTLIGSSGSTTITIMAFDADGASVTTSFIVSPITGLTPTFGTNTRTPNSFTLQISNYSADYTWAGTATGGGTVSINGSGLATITGVPVNTSSTVTITTTRTNYTVGSASITIQPISSSGETDTALSFNGVNQYAAVPSDGVGSIYDFGATWTTQAWIKPGANCVAGYCNIIGKEHSFLISTIGNKLIFCTGNGTGWTIIWREAGGFIPTGAWSHIATTYTGTTLTIYLNGQPIHVSNSVAAVGNNNERFAIGARTGGVYGDGSGERFQGEIDEVRVWNSARSQANIESDMHNSPTLSDSNLTAYFDFNEASGSTIYNRKTGASSSTDLTISGSATYGDVKTVDTSVAAYTIVKFPRTYITAIGGWKSPSNVQRLQYLVVAGGGAGGTAQVVGEFASGGGGGGGVRTGVALTASQQVISARVGQGQVSLGCVQGRGQSSTISGDSISAISATGGGSGACIPNTSSPYTMTAANSGGSGGGGGSWATSSAAAGSGNLGSYSPVEGFAGASARIDGSYSQGQAGGGGGGAGAIGGSPTLLSGNNWNAGSGGIGVQSSITGSDVYYGGGGGGGKRTGGIYGAVGTGGNGGGGNGGDGSSQGTSGAAGLGGGGGGNSKTLGNDGGSGVIIIRWITASAPIYTGPSFDTLTAGLTETFTVTGSATSPLTRNFRWQVSTDTGTSWSNASQGSGFLTANYLTPTLETTTSGIRYQYRVVVTDSDTAGLFIVDTSTAVYLMINPRNTITSSTGSAIFTQKYGESRTAVFTFAYGTGPRTATVASTTNNQNGKITWSNLNSDSATVRVGTALPVGTYSETLTVTDSVTAFTTQALTITVSKADTITVTTTLSTSSVTYTESPAAITTTQTVTGLVNSETATVTSTYTANSCEYGGTCAIGDVAPGGGYVFYVSATTINVATGISSGGIYLATAPQTWSGGSIDPNASFGCGSTNIASTSDSVGSGAENTRLINAGCATAGIASRLAADSSAEGFTDWFIPSIDELTLIYNNLKLNSLSNLQSWNYWSSTQGTTLSYGKYWWFGSGAVSGQTDKNNSAASNMYVRPIRAFSPTALASATVPTDAGVYKVGSTFAISSPASLSNYQGVESVTATLTINKANQRAITLGQYLAYPNISSYPLNVYGGSGPGVLTRTLVSAGTAGCSLASSFILTATSVGSCTVKAEKAGTRNYIVESTTATIYWIAWLDNYAAQTLGGNNVIPLAGGNQIIVRTETLTASAFSNTSGGAITSAAVGATIRINSTGFSGLSPSDLSVTFRPYEDAVVSVVTSTYVEVVIPAGATTGVIAIDSPRGVAYTQSFTISP
ncbi:lectin_L-type domain containing protein [Candidatus Planktophila versatilis]